MNFPKKAFMPFVVIGDTNYENSISIIKSLIDSGADSLELGFPFSDPIADGPVIQKANKRALDSGITTNKCFDILRAVRNYSKIPISLMISFNLVLSFGVENFYKKCNELSIDAILIPDLPLEESKETLFYSQKYNVSQVFIVSPTTSLERLEKIKSVCKGYIYLVSLLGTTGTREQLDSKLKSLIERTKKDANIPVYVGFGISKPEHVEQVLQLGADGAICGSAICKIIEANLNDFNKMHTSLSNFCKEMQRYKLK